MNDQLVAEDATYTTHNKHKRRTSMPSTGFEPAIPAIQWPQTYALERTATGVGCIIIVSDKTKIDGMAGACDTHGGEEKCIQNFTGET
jgi:hypothetical protein